MATKWEYSTGDPRFKSATTDSMLKPFGSHPKSAASGPAGAYGFSAAAQSVELPNPSVQASPIGDHEVTPLVHLKRIVLTPFVGGNQNPIFVSDYLQTKYLMQASMAAAYPGLSPWLAADCPPGEVCPAETGGSAIAFAGGAGRIRATFPPAYLGLQNAGLGIAGSAVDPEDRRKPATASFQINPPDGSRLLGIELWCFLVLPEILGHRFANASLLRGSIANPRAEYELIAHATTLAIVVPEREPGRTYWYKSIYKQADVVRGEFVTVDNSRYTYIVEWGIFDNERFGNHGRDTVGIMQVAVPYTNRSL
jgi:hypothetical protein